jgi:hypothetical protein
MKKLIITAIFFTLTNTLKPQTVNGIALKDLNSHYIEVTARPIPFDPQVKLYIVYGIVYGTYSDNGKSKAGMLRHKAEGEVMNFPSVVDALNFMLENGFELVCTKLDVTMGNNEPSVFFLRNMNKKLE